MSASLPEQKFKFFSEHDTDGGLYSLHVNGWVDHAEFLRQAKAEAADHGEDTDDWEDLSLTVEHKWARRREVSAHDEIRYPDFDYYYETAREPYNKDRKWKKVTWLRYV